MQLVNIQQIRNNEDNPRIIKDYKFKQLVKSIKEFPEMLKLRPIVVNSEMVVLGGNQRLKACREAGLTEVWILKADELTEQQQREFIVKDNVGFGEWDWDVLANEWNNQQLEDWGLDLLPFEDSVEDILKKDLSEKIESSFRLEVELENEIEQEKLYNELINKGFICRLLTL
jgi:ParB-like chromosome segregation protein Spo0J